CASIPSRSTASSARSSIKNSASRAEARPMTTWGRALQTLIILALAVLVGALAWRSRGWPLIHDAPLMHYVAARIREGAVPYRDLFDMNFPGVYLVHLLGLVVGGPGDGSFRALDLAVLAATLTGLGVALATFGRWAVLSGMALFWLYPWGGGGWRAGQRDFLLCLPLAWTLAAALADFRDRAPRTAGPQPRDTFGIARAGRRGPSPATSGHAHIRGRAF